MNMNDSPKVGQMSKAEIARRALKVLTDRRQIPTPESFADAYHEVAGTRVGTVSAASVIKELLKDLQKQQRLSSQDAIALSDSAQNNDWLVVREGVDRALTRRTAAAAMAGGNANWPQLVTQLLKGTDVLHQGWTRARKLDAVARVAEAGAEQPDLALERLTRLLESWGPAMSTLPREEAAAVSAPVLERAAPRSAAPVSAPAVAAPVVDARDYKAEAEAWKQIAQRATALLETSFTEGALAQQKLSEYSRESHKTLASAEIEKLVPRFTDAVVVMERQISEDGKVKAGLQRLLALLCDNMRQLAPEEAWLTGQLEPIKALLSGPVKSAALEQAEVKLARVIAQQSAARESLKDVKVALKEMLHTLVERIGAMGDSTGRYYDKVGGYAIELEQAQDFESLSSVIKGLLSETQMVRADISTSHEELLETRKRVDTYENRVRELERELSQVSNLIQKDHLTQALNRRGFEEAFKMEQARAKRYRAPLSLVMIDVDNFKVLNDTLGHQAGDRALVHLLSVMQTTLRPTDVVGRMGGEEFAVLLPATSLGESIAATARVQRELAKQPFEHEAKKRPITFSAGAAAWHDEEGLDELLSRADGALYQAKRAGKNRVVAEES